MTRELKLALIIAVTLVLGVLVLISDHLSVQRRPKLADPVSVQPERTPPPPVVEAPCEATPAPSTKAGETRLAQAPVVQEPPVEIKQGEPSRIAKADPDEALRRAVELRGGTIENGQVKLPPAVGVVTEAFPPSKAPDSGAIRTVAHETSPFDFTEPKSFAAASAAAKGKTHMVVTGDSAYKIARQYLGDGKYWKKIVDANPSAFAADGQVKVGSKLVIPEVAAPAPAKPAPGVDGKPSPTRLAKAGVKAEKKPYTIRKGDTLHGIAKRELGSSGRAEEILKLNKGVIKDPEALVVGVAIVLPTQQ